MSERLLICLGAATSGKRNWTKEMAEKVGIDRSFLADIERGKRNASILCCVHCGGPGYQYGKAVCSTLKSEYTLRGLPAICNTTQLSWSFLNSQCTPLCAEAKCHLPLCTLRATRNLVAVV